MCTHTKTPASSCMWRWPCCRRLLRQKRAAALKGCSAAGPTIAASWAGKCATAAMTVATIPTKIPAFVRSVIQLVILSSNIRRHHRHQHCYHCWHQNDTWHVIQMKTSVIISIGVLEASQLLRTVWHVLGLALCFKSLVLVLASEAVLGAVLVHWITINFAFRSLKLVHLKGNLALL